MPTFVLNDETKVNSYGFRVLNAGIDLSRLQGNPVMLDFHYDSNQAVLGKWANIRIEGSLLKADADFDIEDENAKKIAGKVERGYIKGASLGLLFNRQDMKPEADGSAFVLEKSEAIEASICPIPSNANALKLYASDTHKLLSSDEIKLSLSQLPTQFQQSNMKKLMLSLAALTALGYNEQPNDDEQSLARLSADIEGIKKQLDAEKTARQTLQKTVDDAASLAAETLVNDAIKAGRFGADKKDTFLSLAKTNLAQAKEIIEAMPAKASLSAMIEKPKDQKLAADRADWTYMDWAKKDSVGLAAMRVNDPQAFEVLRKKTKSA